MNTYKIIRKDFYGNYIAENITSNSEIRLGDSISLGDGDYDVASKSVTDGKTPILNLEPKVDDEIYGCDK